MTQLTLFPVELTDQELENLNLMLGEICEDTYPHEEFFEVEPNIFVEV